jgi:hypothetical protein
MRERLQRLYESLFADRNWKTWIGHGLQAVGIMWLFGWGWAGFWLNLGWWLQREVVADFIQKIWSRGLSETWRHFRDDGLLDMCIPVAVAALLAFFL